MASLILEGNRLVVKCNDGTLVPTSNSDHPKGYSVDRANLGGLNKTVSDAIDAAILKADDAHVDEVGRLADRVAAEAQKIRGQLTAVAPPPERTAAAAKAPEPAAETDTTKRITPPAAVSDTLRQAAAPSRMSMDNLVAIFAECENGSLAPVASLYEDRASWNRYINPESMKEHQEKATCTVFAALWKVSAFRLYLQSQAVNAPEFRLLNDYAAENNGDLSRAGSGVTAGANAFIRHYLVDLMTDGNAAYAQEIGQLPKCGRAMEKMRAEPSNFGILKGPMDSETMVAAALYLRRKALERNNVPENRIEAWVSPEAAAAMAKAREGPKITAPLDTARKEIRW